MHSPLVLTNSAMKILTLLRLNSSTNSSMTYFLPSSSMMPTFTSDTDASNPKLRNRSCGERGV